MLQPAPRFDPQILSWEIPFYPGWVWVYIFYYPFCFLPLFLAPVRRDPAVFLRAVLGFALQFGISFLIFFFWPIRMIHPEIPPGWHARIIADLYRFDGGFNAFPSLHVANTVFVALLFLKFHKRWTGWLLLGCSGLIALSALLVKQHYLHDVLSGALLGWAACRIAFPKSFRPLPLERASRSSRE